jgi:hypothetical protein
MPLGSEHRGLTGMWRLLGWLLTWCCCAAAAAAPANDPPALSAKFTVSTSKHPNPQAWFFSRDAHQVAWFKGSIDEVWHRDAQGRLSFERVFHAERQVVTYSSGELAALGVQADWAALASLVGAQELASLKQVSSRGTGATRRLRLQGVHAGARWRVDWMPAWQLPALIERRTTAGFTRIQLIDHAVVAPVQWPKAGAQSADYLRLDAADAGDMGYEAVMRQSEAMDLRAGWRLPHTHD